jgi:hypothetical protein
MTLQPRLFIAAALSAFAMVAAPAQAGVEHQPQSGTPAYEVDVPDGWQVSRDADGNLYLLAADHSGGLVLNIIGGLDTTSLNLDDLANQSMKVANAPPFTRSEPATVGGMRATAYYSGIAQTGGGTVSVRLTLVKVDATHVASDAAIRSATITPAQSSAIDALDARVHFIR